METLISIAKFAALASITALCVYLIVVLMRLKESLEKLTKEFVELSDKTKPVLSNLDVITAKTKDVMIHVEEQVKSVRCSVDALRSTVDRFTAFERRIEAILEQPFKRIGSLMDELISTFSTAFSFFRMGARKKKD